jgi:transposase
MLWIEPGKSAVSLATYNRNIILAATYRLICHGQHIRRFCDLFAVWRGVLSPTMWQNHPVGERLFVDYAEQTVEVIDAITGEVRTSQIFVAALGASNLTYVPAPIALELQRLLSAELLAIVATGMRKDAAA